MRSLIGAVAVVVVAMPALAAELRPTSRVERVIVFPSGAEVSRVARLKLEPGDHEMILSDLPEQAQTGSIRVEGRASGPMTIGSVDSRRRVVRRDDPEASVAARRKLEDELEAAKDERSRFLAEGQAAEARRNFVQNLVQLPGKTSTAAGTGAPVREDWGALADLIGRETAAAQKAALESEIKVRGVDRRIRELERRLREEAPRIENLTEVVVQVSATAPVDAEIWVRYNVADAGWTPQYDARLLTGTKAQAAKLTLTRRASVSQRTSEPWQNVELSLSTTRPAAGTAAPELRPLTVDFVPDRPVPQATAPGAFTPRAPATGRASEAAAEDDARKRMDNLRTAAPEPMQEAGEQRAQAQTTAFQAVYEIPGRQTISNTGDPRRLTVETSETEPQLMVRAAPRIDARAFLYAKLVMPRAAPALPGAVALFRDGTFVGSGRLPQLAGGEEHELGFGADDRVRVRASVVEDKRGETGIIAASKTEQRQWRLTIRNLHERPIAFTIHDQLPVSGNQDIKVELLGRPVPSRRDIEDKRGVLAWDDRLNPDEEKAIEFGYRITWPGARSIMFGR